MPDFTHEYHVYAGSKTFQGNDSSFIIPIPTQPDTNYVADVTIEATDGADTMGGPNLMTVSRSTTQLTVNFANPIPGVEFILNWKVTRIK